MGASLVLLAGAGAGAGAGAAQAKTLVFCSEGTPDFFNPWLSTSATAYDVGDHVYGRLVRNERGTMKLVPDLAERWEMSDDGRTYTFHLRRGVKWQETPEFKPTREFTSADVVFTFERMLKPDHPFHRVSGGLYPFFNIQDLSELIEAVEAVDDHTVRFRLRRPDAPFISNIGYYAAVIQSAEYAEHVAKRGTPEKLDLEPVGTGPFQIVQYQKDVLVRFRPFKGYWGAPSPLSQLVFSITPDPSVRFAKLRRGECHVMSYPNQADLPAMRADPNIVVMSRTNSNISYLSLNTEKPPLNDRRVRQAINMAIDRRAIIEHVYLGQAVQARNPIPPDVWTYNEATPDWPHDPERAKALLAEAGLADGFDMDLWAMSVSRAYNPNARRMAEMMQADLAKVGIRARIVTYEWGEYTKRLRGGEHMAALMGLSTLDEPNDILYGLLSCDAARIGVNYARWCHKPYDDLVVAARSTIDREERAEMYRRAQLVFHEEAPWVPIAHAAVPTPVRREVVDFRPNPASRFDFHGVDLK